MDKKEAFRQGLRRLREKAESQGLRVTVSDILACFPDRELTRDQIRLIYQYAAEEHITIDDYKPRDTRSVSLSEPKLTGTEKESFKMYLKDLKRVRRCSDEEAMMLTERLMNGDLSAAKRLIEGHLHLVLELAAKHAGNGVLIGDLVQEGNVELVTAVDELSSGSTMILGGGFRHHIISRVEQVMKCEISAQSGHEKAADRIAQETNRLLAATMELEDELGREATLAELSERVGLPEENVKELIRISLSAAEFANRDAEKEGGSGRE